jgi:hypothetical protein
MLCHAVLCRAVSLQGASMFDGSAILKPALARGQLRCLGCSSPDKFKKTIEKDPGLERRFQLVGQSYHAREESGVQSSVQQHVLVKKRAVLVCCPGCSRLKYIVTHVNPFCR